MVVVIIVFEIVFEIGLALVNLKLKHFRTYLFFAAIFLIIMVIGRNFLYIILILGIEIY